jgi:hypothetical protein
MIENVSDQKLLPLPIKQEANLSYNFTLERTLAGPSNVENVKIINLSKILPRIVVDHVSAARTKIG